MVELVMSAAESSATPWWVLTGAAVIILVEAARSCRKVLWGDFGDDED